VSAVLSLGADGVCEKGVGELRLMISSVRRRNLAGVTFRIPMMRTIVCRSFLRQPFRDVFRRSPVSAPRVFIAGSTMPATSRWLRDIVVDWWGRARLFGQWVMWRYTSRSGCWLHDCVTAIRHGTRIDSDPRRATAQPNIICAASAEIGDCTGRSRRDRENSRGPPHGDHSVSTICVTSSAVPNSAPQAVADRAFETI